MALPTVTRQGGNYGAVMCLFVKRADQAPLDCAVADCHPLQAGAHVARRDSQVAQGAGGSTASRRGQYPVRSLYSRFGASRLPELRQQLGADHGDGHGVNGVVPMVASVLRLLPRTA